MFYINDKNIKRYYVIEYINLKKKSSGSWVEKVIIEFVWINLCDGGNKGNREVRRERRKKRLAVFRNPLTSVKPKENLFFSRDLVWTIYIGEPLLRGYGAYQVEIMCSVPGNLALLPSFHFNRESTSLTVLHLQIFLNILYILYIYIYCTID